MSAYAYTYSQSTNTMKVGVATSINNKAMVFTESFCVLVELNLGLVNDVGLVLGGGGGAKVMLLLKWAVPELPRRVE
ncbi:unnamed protein product [Allacma fusca]|uniref:Uncharacterized protein n=1 Tax=Allacma fusca TaxID=39272 RepID=A0A8J2LXK5_9HEXA|nr:unnamed protein product [Allacma fusca]